MRTRHTREKWAERIRGWQASGLSAEAYAEGKDFAASGLRWAASRLREEKAVGAPRRRRSVEQAAPSGATARFLPLRAVSAAVDAEVVVEVNGARILVHRGTDLSLVSEVVRALAGGVR